MLVPGFQPTPAGEGKTTAANATVWMRDSLNHIRRRAIGCMREPSLGPVFGIKGGVASDGYTQVVPMDDIDQYFIG